MHQPVNSIHLQPLPAYSVSSSHRQVSLHFLSNCKPVGLPPPLWLLSSHQILRGSTDSWLKKWYFSIVFLSSPSPVWNLVRDCTVTPTWKHLLPFFILLYCWTFRTSFSQVTLPLAPFARIWLFFSNNYMYNQYLSISSFYFTSSGYLLVSINKP